MCLGINKVPSPVMPQAPQGVQGQTEVKKLSADRFKMFQGKVAQVDRTFRPHQPRAVGESAKRLAKTLVASKPAVKTPVARMNALIKEVNDLAPCGTKTLDVESWASAKIRELEDVERQLTGEMEAACRESFEEELKSIESKGKPVGAGGVAARKEAARNAAKKIIEGIGQKTKLVGPEQKAYFAALDKYVEALCAPVGGGKVGKTAYVNAVHQCREQLLKAERGLRKDGVRVGFDPGKVRADILSIGNTAKLKQQVELQKRINLIGRAFRTLSPDLRKAVRMEIAKEMLPKSIAARYKPEARDAILKHFGGSVREVRRKYTFYANALKAFAETPSQENRAKLAEAGKALSQAATAFKTAFRSDFENKTDRTLGGLARAYADKGATAKKEFPAGVSVEQLQSFLQDCISDGGRGIAAFKALTGQSYYGISDGCGAPALEIVLQHLDQTAESDKKPLLFAGKDVAQTLFGKSTPGQVSNRAMALAMGARDENISKFIDAQSFEVTTLGSGAMNDVLKFTVKTDNGKESYVFKPELAGATGLRIAGPSVHAHYDEKQGMVGLNIATCKMAGLIGCPNVVVDSKAMVVNNRYGLQMELAKGTEAGLFGLGKDKKDVKNYNTFVKLLKSPDLAPDKRQNILKLANSLFRQATDLQWLDRLTVQGDRHALNYKVAFHRDWTVTLKGIDNDQAFPTGQPSISRFTWDDPKDISQFVTGLAANLGYGTGDTGPKDPVGWLKNAMNGNLKSLPPNAREKLKAGTRGIAIRNVAGKDVLTIDTANCSEKVRTVLAGSGFGFRTLNVPSVMSAGMHAALVSIGTNRGAKSLEEVVKENLNGLVSEANIKSAASRLKEMIELARDYEKNGRIIPDDGWTDAKTAGLLKGELKEHPYGSNGPKNWGSYAAANYAARDFYELVDAFAGAPTGSVEQGKSGEPVEWSAIPET